MLCPACENESTNTQQCTTCEWMFVNFTEEPTEEEQNDYTQLLYRHRSNFYFVLAVQYYDNKQYKEVIECCKISCEQQLFENPLALMASAYLELGNKEEALKFVNMALEINPKNEFALPVLDELNEKLVCADKILVLTPEILRQDMFETTQEYTDRIKNMGYTEIGTVKLLNYSADTNICKFSYKINENLIDINFLNLKNLSFFNEIDYLNIDQNFINIECSLHIPTDKAKKLFEKSEVNLLLAKIKKVDNNNIMLNALSISDFNIDSILLENKMFWPKKDFIQPFNDINCANLAEHIQLIKNKDALIYTYLIYLYSTSGNHNKAKETYDFIIDKFPEFSPAYNTFAKYNENSIKNAIYYYNKSLDVNSSYALTYKSLAKLAKEVNKQIYYAKESIKIDSKAIDMYALLVDISLNENKVAEAKNYTQFMIEIADGSHFTKMALGNIAVFEGNDEKAFEYYDQASKYTGGYTFLGLRYESLDKKKAIQYHNKALKISPDDAWSIARLNILKKLHV